METNDFFLEISKPVEGENNALLIEKLFRLAKAINEMSPDDLVAMFQALSMLKKTQPSGFFKTNPIRRSIEDTQLIVINAMQKNRAYAGRFNDVIRHEWINGSQYHVTN